MPRYVHPETERAFNEAYGKLRRERDGLKARVAELTEAIQAAHEPLSEAICSGFPTCDAFHQLLDIVPQPTEEQESMFGSCAYWDAKRK